MAKRIGVLEAFEPQTAEPRSFVKKNVANYLVRKLLAVRIPGRNLIQKLPAVADHVYQQVKSYWDGPLGVGNALPFSRQSDGGRLHYEMPHAGDVGLWRHYKKFIRVSARPQSHLAAQLFQRTHLNAPALADAFQH